MTDALQPIVDHVARKDAAEAKTTATLALERSTGVKEAFEKASAHSEKARDRIYEAIEKVHEDNASAVSRIHGRLDKLLYGILAAVIAIIGQIVLTKIGLI